MDPLHAELRRNRIEPSLATRLSQILINQRVILESCAIRERKLLDTSPLYLRAGEPIPDGMGPERVVWIKRTFVEPEPRKDEVLLVSQEPSSSDSVEPQRQEQPTPLDYPEWGVV